VFAYHSRNFPEIFAEAKAGTKGIEPSFAERHSAVVTIGPRPQIKVKIEEKASGGTRTPGDFWPVTRRVCRSATDAKRRKVGMAGLEPAASTFVESRAIHLRHIPKDKHQIKLNDEVEKEKARRRNIRQRA
jgi:hypothetical protein